MRRILQTLAAAVAVAFLVHALERLENTGPQDRPVAFDAPLPHTIRGSGVTDIGNLRIPPNTILTWHCPECGPPTKYWAGSTFQVFNDQEDPQLILMGINALGQRQGTEILNGGTYHDVYIETAAAHWSLTFSRERSQP